MKLIGGARGGKVMSIEDEHGGVPSLVKLAAEAPEGYRPVTLAARGAFGVVAETRVYVATDLKLPAVLDLLLGEYGG
jgi:hypothetical protein